MPVLFPESRAQFRVFLNQRRLTQLLRHNVFTDEARNVVRRALGNFFLAQATDRCLTLFRGLGDSANLPGTLNTLDATGRLLAETHASGTRTAAAGAAKAFCVASDRGNFPLFFGEDTVKATDGFLKRFFEPRFALGLSLTRVLTNRTTLAATIVGRATNTVGPTVIFLAFTGAVETTRRICATYRPTDTLYATAASTTAFHASGSAAHATCRSSACASCRAASGTTGRSARSAPARRATRGTTC